jgi:hypothetical protein
MLGFGFMTTQGIYHPFFTLFTRGGEHGKKFGERVFLTDHRKKDSSSEYVPTPPTIPSDSIGARQHSEPANVLL